MEGKRKGVEGREEKGEEESEMRKEKGKERAPYDFLIYSF